jgi:tetratricopeptide (TPR) repeat protein
MIATLIGATIFAIYAVGACSTIYVGDSGELVTAVHLLGIPHPTGYPLYVLTGKLWTLALPYGSVALRMSLFSAACGAGAAALVYRMCRRVEMGGIAALFAATTLAFSPSFWSQANIQRVYTLGALFVVLATLSAWRWYEDRSTGALALTFFLCGLGATNHTFMVIYAVVFGGFAIVTERVGIGLIRRLLAAGGAFTLGLLPYAYLPLRSRANPRLDWGNPETLDTFLGVILRRDFWERAWFEGPSDFFPIGLDYSRSLASELAWLGAVLAVVGVVVGWRRGYPVVLFVLVMLGNVGAMALHGSRTDLFVWHRYYIPSYIMMALLAGVGCDALVARAPRLLRVVPLGIPLFLLVTGWHAHDRSRYRVAEEFGEAVLDALPPGAHLVASDDNILFSLLYMHLVEQRRPDINLVPQGIGAAELPALRFNPDREPLFFTHHPNWRIPSLDVVPVGLLFRASRTGAPAPPVVRPDGLPGADDPRVPKDYLTQNLIGQYHYMLGCTDERRDWPRARREFTAATTAAPHNDVLFYNLGLIYRRNGLIDDAIAAFERAGAINPRHLASHSKPRAEDRLVELRAERARLSDLAAELAGDGSLHGIDPESAAYHRGLAELLDRRGEDVAARGHQLRALEIEAAGARGAP